MCLSPGVDLMVGVVVGGLAIDAWQHVTDPAERGLATIPIVLGAHQIIEAFVWFGLDGRVPGWLGTAALCAYLVIAFAVVPVLVPLAVVALEPAERRPRMAWFTYLGVAVAVALLVQLVSGSPSARIEHLHIAYHADITFGGLLVALYVVATCGPLLWSSHRNLALFGAVNLGVVGLLVWSVQSGFVSLWCFWAAVTSMAIVAHLRFSDRGVVAPALFP